MVRLRIERRGGFTGLPAHGEVDLESLSTEDQAAVEALFRPDRRPEPPQGADRFVYTLIRRTGDREDRVEAPEHLLPDAIAGAVVDSLP